MKFVPCILMAAAATTAAEYRAKVFAAQPQPRPVIFDTDIGNDIDDVLALGVLHALANRAECEVLAVTITNADATSAPFVDAVNTFYGRGEIPIGVVRNGQTWEPSRYTSLADRRDGGNLRYPHDLLNGRDAEAAVAVLRKSLSSADDGTVVIVQVGTSTNLAHLLESPPDVISPLTGTELARQKVRLLSVMAGAFAKFDGQTFREFNVLGDVRAAQKIAGSWPTPIVYSGFEIGSEVTYPAESIEHDFAYVEHHPLAESYRLHSPPTHNRPAWDLTSVLYAVRPDRGYFGLSARGRVQITADGKSLFAFEDDGPHQFLIATPEQLTRVREALIQLASQPPLGSQATRDRAE